MFINRNHSQKHYTYNWSQAARIWHHNAFKCLLWLSDISSSYHNLSWYIVRNRVAKPVSKCTWSVMDFSECRVGVLYFLIDSPLDFLNKTVFNYFVYYDFHNSYKSWNPMKFPELPQQIPLFVMIFTTADIRPGIQYSFLNQHSIQTRKTLKHHSQQIIYTLKWVSTQTVCLTLWSEETY